MATIDEESSLIDALGEDGIGHVFSFLDPLSLYRLGMAVRRSDTVSGLAAASLIRRSLPSNLIPRNPREIFEDNEVVETLSEEAWRRKRTCIENLWYFHISRHWKCVGAEPKRSVRCSGRPDFYQRIESWLGEDFAAGDAEVVTYFVRSLMHATLHVALLKQNRVHQAILQMSDFRKTLNHVNVTTSFTLERMFELPFLTIFGGSETPTLLELSAMDTNKEIYDLEDYSERERIPHSEQVKKARENLACMQQKLREDASLMFGWHKLTRQTYEPVAFDPYEHLGGNNSCDSNWEEWVAWVGSFGEERQSPRWSEEEISALGTTIESELASLVSSPPCVLKPHFRLCAHQFGDICACMLMECITMSCVSTSALDFLQSIVEDLIFGVAIRPFWVEHPGIERPVLCHFIVGQHGTTMFSLSSHHDLWEDEDDDDSDYEMESEASDVEERVDHFSALSAVSPRLV